MTVPSRTILLLLGLVGVLLIAALSEPMLFWAALALDGGVIAVCFAEGWHLRTLPVEVRRRWPPRLQINRQVNLVFEISNRSNRALDVILRQPWPDELVGEKNRLVLKVGPGEQVRAALSVMPIRRGRVSCRPLEVDIGHGLGLARRRWSQQEGGELTIYPDLQSLVEYDVLRRSRALRQMGIHRQRIVGAGREFEQLRDYLPDDDYRDINWKATARRRHPVTNIFQVERSRDVMLCLDCGRMMGNPIGTGTALDRAVDAAIMLAHVSNRQADRTGLALFGDAVDLLVRPRAGRGAINAVIERLVDVEPRPVFPSYAQLAEALRSRQSHRALVFLFTDLNDPQLAADLAAVMPLLSSRHMVVVVSLRDALLDRVAWGPAQTRRELYEVLAARELATDRDAHRAELVKAGVQVLEADAERLTIDVINAYLSIKQRQLL